MWLEAWHVTLTVASVSITNLDASHKESIWKTDISHISWDSGHIRRREQHENEQSRRFLGRAPMNREHMHGLLLRLSSMTDLEEPECRSCDSLDVFL